MVSIELAKHGTDMRHHATWNQGTGDALPMLPNQQLDFRFLAIANVDSLGDAEQLPCCSPALHLPGVGGRKASYQEYIFTLSLAG
jgi:hypothetical protein